MQKLSLILCSLAALAVGPLPIGAAESMSDAMPKMLGVLRESVKVGRETEHAKHEAGFPAAYAKANSSDYYLALTSLTGPGEAWYIAAYESNAGLGETMKRDEKDPVLSAELARLFRIDAEYVSATRNVLLKARPDLSAGQFPDLGKTRFIEVTTYRVRIGREADFEEVGKAFTEALKRTSPKGSYAVYEVAAGMVQPTYMILTAVESYADFDRIETEGMAAWKILMSEKQGLITKGADGILEVETNRFKVDPGQSYMPTDIKDSDPEFWSAK